MGPLFADDGPAGARLTRRARGLAAEWLGLLVLTALLPLLVPFALLVDLVLLVVRRKPLMAIRLVAFLWLFLLTDVRCFLGLVAINTASFGRDTPRRRRGVYRLRIHWCRSHLGAVRVLFRLRFEVEGLELAAPGPAIVLCRHASIIDNLLPDAVIGGAHGIGLRFVIKRELQVLPVIDVGARWVPTAMVRRGGADTAGDAAKTRALTQHLGADEAILIYPEGTRHTDAKLARAIEVLRERRPDVADLAARLHHTLPPRLGGTLALLEARGDDCDVVLCGHVGLDGFEYVSDIWAGGLVGGTVRVRFWRHAAADVPRDPDALVRWLFDRWQELDDWIGAQRAELGTAGAPKARGRG